ncbi:twin-arginine translocase subunit TatB [Desulfohalobiaceae bacterium Ax17]|jgi:sec-independent protein translocase protein TatB|uniref:Sec-independent protein translocase protein TatB n=1 Tax=Desulfovulcanus ferrireducens TaxID=2831190 RepID=UPI00207BBA41|nr:Sec-independent protein translocase protein TatB [Desulfovulcanus ferrireducens]MBT8762406.1 twin-arginine translocase subunit TatB [Desulfovulcanus ferrireducens]
MFGIGSTELLIILVVALIVIGPSKLPEIAKTLGKAMAEFRRVSSDVKRTIEMEVEKEEERRTKEEVKKDFKTIEQEESSESSLKNEETKDDQEEEVLIEGDLDEEESSTKKRASLKEEING